jgi:hypothetical protein
MSPADHPEDSDPLERVPAGPLFVPVRPGPSGCSARFFRTPMGGRTAVGFTTEEKLSATLGTDQPRIRLSEPALRALAVPLGVTALTVDPQFSAPAASGSRAREGSSRDWDAQHIGLLRGAGAAAALSCLNMFIG